MTKTVHKPWKTCEVYKPNWANVSDYNLNALRRDRDQQWDVWRVDDKNSSELWFKDSVQVWFHHYRSMFWLFQMCFSIWLQPIIAIIVQTTIKLFLLILIILVSFVPAFLFRQYNSGTRSYSTFKKRQISQLSNHL